MTGRGVTPAFRTVLALSALTGMLRNWKLVVPQTMGAMLQITATAAAELGRQARLLAPQV